jgi:hypothetical protein
LLAALLGTPLSAAIAGQASLCQPGHFALWGDAVHDDTAALNAWFQGENVVWAESGAAIGAAIADHSFLLSGAIYVPSGAGRRLERFRLVWPARHETVSGGALLTGDDPRLAPIALGIERRGGDAGEGVPFAGADPEPRQGVSTADCPVS